MRGGLRKGGRLGLRERLRQVETLILGHIRWDEGLDWRLDLDREANLDREGDLKSARLRLRGKLRLCES